jgi:hypothetical protein
VVGAAATFLLVTAGTQQRVPEPEPEPTATAPTATAVSARDTTLPQSMPAEHASVAPTAASSGSAPPTWVDEDALMTEARSMVDVDAAAALAIAREGDRRFPSGDAAAERAMIEVKALARQGRLSEARGAAEQMVNRYPGSPWALEVERHTGAHPRINH